MSKIDENLECGAADKDSGPRRENLRALFVSFCDCGRFLSFLQMMEFIFSFSSLWRAERKEKGNQGEMINFKFPFVALYKTLWLLCVCLFRYVCLRPERIKVLHWPYRDSIHFLFMGDISLQNVQRKPPAPPNKDFFYWITHSRAALINTHCLQLGRAVPSDMSLCRSQFKPAVIWVPVAYPSSPTSPGPFWPLTPDITQAFSSTQPSLCCDEMVRVQISSGWWHSESLQSSSSFTQFHLSCLYSNLSTPLHACSSFQQLLLLPVDWLISLFGLTSNSIFNRVKWTVLILPNNKLEKYLLT